MATFKASEEQKYSNGGGTRTGFFSIPDNHGVKRVRFYVDNESDVEGSTVHKIKIGEKKRYVDCLRSYDDPISKCPFCRDHFKLESRYFIPLYNVEDDAAQIWDRGVTYLSELTGLCSRYAKKRPLTETVFEIERNGEKGDKQTRYKIYKWEPDEDDEGAWDDVKSADELPDPPKILGGFVLEKSAEDMEYYIKHHDFPREEEEDSEPPRRRGGSEDRAESTIRRRTPAGRDERF